MTKPIKIKLPDTHEEWMEQRRSGLGAVAIQVWGIIQLIF